MSRAVDRFGGLTGVCLNAGTFGPCHRLHESDPEKWMKGLQVNLLSHLYTVSWHQTLLSLGTHIQRNQTWPVMTDTLSVIS